MSFITILTRTISAACLVAMIIYVFVINSSASLGTQISNLDHDLAVISRINGELSQELSNLHDINRIASRAQELGFVNANTAMTVTLPDPLAMQQ